MTKRKATITVDPDKVNEANKLIGSENFSATVERALDMLIRHERGQRDLEAYQRIPQERGLAAAGAHPALDDTDWEEIYKDLL